MPATEQQTAKAARIRELVGELNFQIEEAKALGIDIEIGIRIDGQICTSQFSVKSEFFINRMSVTDAL